MPGHIRLVFVGSLWNPAIFAHVRTMPTQCLHITGLESAIISCFQPCIHLTGHPGFLIGLCVDVFDNNILHAFLDVPRHRLSILLDVYRVCSKQSSSASMTPAGQTLTLVFFPEQQRLICRNEHHRDGLRSQCGDVVLLWMPLWCCCRPGPVYFLLLRQNPNEEVRKHSFHIGVLKGSND